MKEQAIVKAILDFLHYRKTFSWRNNTGGFMKDSHFYRFGSKGSPDIFVVINGKIIGIECKNERGKQTLAQEEWQESFEKAGGFYFLVHSLDDFIFQLEELIRWSYNKNRWFFDKWGV